jgi:retron-type reverse transcriptase
MTGAFCKNYESSIASRFDVLPHSEQMQYSRLTITKSVELSHAGQ